MEGKKFEDRGSEMKKEFHIQIPCRLAERIEAYASLNNATITGVVIEALDTFLRRRQNS